MKDQGIVQSPNTHISVKISSSIKHEIWKPFFKLIAKVKLPYLWIILSIISALGQTKLSLLFPQYTQKITSGDISRPTIIIAAAVVLGQAMLTSISQFIGRIASSKVSLSFRKFIWKQLVHLSIPFYDKNMPKEMISRTTNDTTKLSDFFAFSIANVLSSIYQLVGSFVILFSYNWRLAAAEAIIIPLIYLIGIINGRVSFKWNNRIQMRLAKLTEFLSEILLNIPLVKAFVKEDTELKRGEECIDKLYKTKFKYSCVSSVLALFIKFTDVLQTIIVIVLGIYLISKKIIAIDVWIAFYMYAQGLSASVNVVMNTWKDLKTCQGAVRRITEIAVELGEKYKNSLHYKKENSYICFEDVTFKYSKKSILENLSFKIPYGKVTAIVGPSGGGKTTIFNLIERFYEPNSGKIKIGNKLIKDYNLMEWRKAFGYVSQDSKLFSGTIRENIIYGIDRKVSEEEIIRAADAAFALGFITTFKNGFDTEVGEGGCKLSGGQRQRISIARVILKNPEYLLLDEATSSLDAESEYMVEKALNDLAAGRTTIVIAHRLSTIEKADQIIVLDNKKISGVGTHKSLLENNKLYKQLIEIQKKVEMC
ncbi:ABC transporter ATP-binding protein [Clostridium botulinum]|uniref:ABC transporter ATP-binding protein n=1 Tax=Clostridium botulinum TaxID=1491 RepID=UPI0013F96E29|nr:ABC transporter ATP-binding protein [Clostridium botulinum]MCJ8171516.1 ABC transporter ATP-binding protein/permease [Clostridium botulinum]NFD55858.1 ABC transporter ATP-binding protein [Clostridium botulinum]NFK77319.1 ABC transporter ATP-binding protein [Clostridium botulinum]NFM47347.1 ABC transporter ATP-binding protein [Clostridium botulinum]